SPSAALGSWTINADANRNNTVSDSNTFTVTAAPYVPTLGNVDVLFYSNAGYSTYATSFARGSTAYYEIRTFDVNGSVIDVTDLNTTLRDSLSVVKQSLTGLSTSSGIYQGSYSIGLSDALGSWNLQADANRNSAFSDSNNFTVTPFIECPTQAACFSQSWNSAVMACQSSGSPSGRYCQLSQTSPFWTISNTSSGTSLQLSRIMVSWTGDTDGDTSVDVITINNVQRNSLSSASGAWNNITDFNISASQTISTNNWLRWQGSTAAGRMNNETEAYTLTFEFSDGSTYSTLGYNPP
ncbi:MAG TPA: hypothetical protein VFF09_03510, partial [archaeon]|nr:hypothetical protein [archaeon]